MKEKKGKEQDEYTMAICYLLLLYWWLYLNPLTKIEKLHFNQTIKVIWNKQANKPTKNFEIFELNLKNRIFEKSRQFIFGRYKIIRFKRKIKIWMKFINEKKKKNKKTDRSRATSFRRLERIDPHSNLAWPPEIKCCDVPVYDVDWIASDLLWGSNWKTLFTA